MIYFDFFKCSAVIKLKRKRQNHIWKPPIIEAGIYLWVAGRRGPIPDQLGTRALRAVPLRHVGLAFVPGMALWANFRAVLACEARKSCVPCQPIGP